MKFNIKNILKTLLILSCVGTTQIKAGNPYDPDSSGLPVIPREQVAEQNSQCIICPNPILQSDPVATMPNCSHGKNYHRACLDNWRKDNDTCPECRKKITVFDVNTLSGEAKIDYKRQVASSHQDFLQEHLAVIERQNLDRHEEAMRRGITEGVAEGFKRGRSLGKDERNREIARGIVFTGTLLGTSYFLLKNTFTRNTHSTIAKQTMEDLGACAMWFAAHKMDQSLLKKILRTSENNEDEELSRAQWHQARVLGLRDGIEMGIYVSLGTRVLIEAVRYVK